MNEDQAVILSNDLYGVCISEAFNAIADDIKSFLTTYNGGEFNKCFVWWLDRKESFLCFPQLHATTNFEFIVALVITRNVLLYT